MSMMHKILRRFCIATPIMMTACVAAVPGSADTSGPGAAYGPFLAARYADAQQDPAAAIRYYDKALAADPQNRALLDEDFIAAVVAGNPQAAKLAPEVGNNALAIMLLGNQAAQTGDYAEAVKQYQSLPHDELSGLLAPLLVAWAQLGQGNAQAALATLMPLTTVSSPFSGIYLLNAALIADQSNDMKDATALYAQVGTGSDAPNLRLAQVIASWDARQGNLDAAKTELTQMAQTHPALDDALPALIMQIKQPVINTPVDGLAEAYLTIAGSLTQPSQAALRLSFLHFALALRPDIAAARLLLANVLTGNNQPNADPSATLRQQALDALQPIATTDPLFITAALQEAALMASLNQTQAAVDLMNKLLANDPHNIELLGTTGDILRTNNQYQDAVPYYTRAIAELPNPPPAGAWTLYYDRGISIDQGGGSDWAKAEPDLQEALKLAPNQPFVLNYIGFTWALHGENLTQARDMLTQAVSMAPKEGAIIDSLGYVNLKTGDTKTAIKLLIQAVEMDPDDAEINAHLGDAFYADGQKLQADYQWQRALALKPDAKLQADIEAKLKQFSPPT